MADNIYLNLAKARVEVQKQCTKKSGLNKFAGFEYFELKDFLTVATNELLKVGLVALFNIKQSINEQGVVIEEPSLTITDGTNKIEFVTPSANANVKGANEIQNLGSKHTYLKRYLYMNALELSEADGVDATIGKDKQESSQKKGVASSKQIEILKQYYTGENLSKLLEFNKISKLEDISKEKATELINRIMEKQKWKSQMN